MLLVFPWEAIDTMNCEPFPQANDKDVAQCWDANAQVWTRQVRAGYDVFRELMNNPAFFALVGDLDGKQVLDAGCGEGHNTRLFARQGAKLCGVDISAEMIAQAQAQEQAEPLGIDYRVGSIAKMDEFADASFDVVVSTMALMDCADYAGAVREFWRVLRPGGMLAFNICHPCFTYEIRDWDYDENGEVIGVRLGNYFRRDACVERWKFSTAPEAEITEPFQIIYFNRTLADYINPLGEVGFRIEAIAEPRPTDEACAKVPSLKRHQLAPQTLCVKARKDG
jgi:ubiquinone/menaquinone biosynthesis C-methylase UbiE